MINKQLFPISNTWRFISFHCVRRPISLLYYPQNENCARLKFSQIYHHFPFRSLYRVSCVSDFELSPFHLSSSSSSFPLLKFAVYRIQSTVFHNYTSTFHDSRIDSKLIQLISIPLHSVCLIETAMKDLAYSYPSQHFQSWLPSFGGHVESPWEKQRLLEHETTPALWVALVQLSAITDIGFFIWFQYGCQNWIHATITYRTFDLVKVTITSRDLYNDTRMNFTSSRFMISESVRVLRHERWRHDQQVWIRGRGRQVSHWSIADVSHWSQQTSVTDP